MKKVIGIDLGGTTIYGGLVNDQGEILKRRARATPKGQGARPVLDEIIDLIGELMDQDILGIGIGSPGTIDPIRGQVLDIGGNIEGWAHTDIRKEISRAYPDLDIYVENDANLAGLAEGWLGAGRDLDSFVMITLGTGLGGCIYLEKDILRGHGFQAGELGHVILYPRGRQCSCGQKGCVERYISGNGLEDSYYEARGKRKKGKDIFRDYSLDRTAQEVVENYCQDLAIFIASLKNIFDPQGLIIGGGVINSQDIWWDKMLDYYRDYSNSSSTMEILPAQYLNDAGMIGAGRLVFLNSN